jgi:hypothetical protein
MVLVKIDSKWKQTEINEYFNLRLNTIEKYMPQLIVGFASCIPDEESVNESTVFSAATKAEILVALAEIKDNVKKK